MPWGYLFPPRAACTLSRVAFVLAGTTADATVYYCSREECAMSVRQITLQQINSLDQRHFIEVLGPLFEGPPWIVEEAWQQQPFATLAALYQTLCTIMYEAPVERQVELLRAHPDLVGRAALAGTLSPSSTDEQAAAGLSNLSPEEIATFTRLNAAYTERFTFPFVICARENKKESILAGFASRLQNTREQEITIALGEVAKICLLRLYDLVQSDTVANPKTTYGPD
jgi:2-oxo-4-hydroxy-4-carboxy-5-ureidoimidazoline decarboxylase